MIKPFKLLYFNKTLCFEFLQNPSLYLCFKVIYTQIVCFIPAKFPFSIDSFYLTRIILYHNVTFHHNVFVFSYVIGCRLIQTKATANHAAGSAPFISTDWT